jgi:glucose/arabinose dehydrogenase
MALAITISACDDGDDDDGPAATPTPAVSAEATRPAGGARVPSSTTPAVRPAQDSYQPVEVFPAVDFERMVAMREVPGEEGAAVVVTQRGIVFRVTLDAQASEPVTFLDVSDRLIDNPGNEEGLLGLAFAPDYVTNREFYVYYTAGDPRRSIIARYRAPGATADTATEEIVMEIPQPFRNHNGGALEFGPDGMLYIALGDGGSGGDPLGNGQNVNEVLGSILRIDVSGDDAYTIPPDNPFASGGGAPEIFAYGFRNPWRFTFDRETGAIWAGDVGQGTWEEVDRVERGANYGWNVMEGPDCFRGGNCGREGLVPPRAAYRTGEAGACAVTGGYVYRGETLPELRGWYVYADYCSGHVWALDTSDDASDPVLLMGSEKQIPAFFEDSAGELYLVTFNRAIYRIDRR